MESPGARDVHSASDLAAGANLWCIAHVDHQGVSLFNHVTGLIRRDLRNRRVSSFQHLSDACYHLILLWSGHRHLSTKPGTMFTSKAPDHSEAVPVANQIQTYWWCRPPRRDNGSVEYRSTTRSTATVVMADGTSEMCQQRRSSALDHAPRLPWTTLQYGAARPERLRRHAAHPELDAVGF